VDWANAALDAKSVAATIETVRRWVIISSMKLTMPFNRPNAAMFRN
jgi:hypothetical protein